MSEGFDVNDLKRSVEAARRVEVKIDGRTFSLVYPDRTERARMAMLNQMADGKIDEVGFSRALVSASIREWDCVVGDAHPESKRPEVPMPVSKDTIAIVLGEREQWMSEMFVSIFRHYSAREEALEAVRKNSPAASPGNEPEDAANLNQQASGTS
jgi:hypothetical protein